jgi:hypothetical protein
MLLGYCYSCGLLGADCMYSLLAALAKRFEEADVALMFVLLHNVGLQLRAADPGRMKVGKEGGGWWEVVQPAQGLKGAEKGEAAEG